MDEAEPAVEGHGDRHAGFGDRVHVCGHEGDVEIDPVREPDVELGVAWKDVGVEGGERDVVVRQCRVPVHGEEFLSGEVETAVEIVEQWSVCHGEGCGGEGD